MEPKRHWVDEHWFWRGFQSAVFLYAQCGPCLAWRESHRQKKEYKMEKKERARNPDDPNVIRQPAPHEVNPHWAEEIRLGPSPPKRGRKRANTKSSRDTASSGTLVASDTAGSSKSELHTDSKDRPPVFWNARRYQRADEEYAYVGDRPSMVYAPPGLVRRGSSVGIGPWMTDDAKPPGQPKRAYTPTANMPPVNELHPPVVSSVPSKKEDRAWMTAPPPSTAFMHGKKGVTTRSRSGSDHSSLQSNDVSLGRQVGLKIVEEKIKNGELPEDRLDLIASPSHRVDSKLEDAEVGEQEKAAEAPVAKPRSASTSPFRLAQEKEQLPSMKRERRPAPLRLNTGRAAKSRSTKIPTATNSDASSTSDSSSQRGRSKNAQQPPTKTRLTARSALNSNPVSSPAAKPTTTTASSGSGVSDGALASSILGVVDLKDSATITPLSSSRNVVDTCAPLPRKRRDTKLESDDAPLLVRDSSLHRLQDVVDPNRLLRSQRIESPAVEARLPLPPGDRSRKENEAPATFMHASAKEELLMQEGSRRWSLGI